MIDGEAHAWTMKISLIFPCAKCYTQALFSISSRHTCFGSQFEDKDIVVHISLQKPVKLTS